MTQSKGMGTFPLRVGRIRLAKDDKLKGSPDLVLKFIPVGQTKKALKIPYDKKFFELLYAIGAKIKSKKLFHHVFVWNDTLMGIGDDGIFTTKDQPPRPDLKQRWETVSLVTALANKMDDKLITFGVEVVYVENLVALRSTCTTQAKSIYELYEENYKDMPGQTSLFWTDPTPFDRTPQFFREGVLVG